MCICCFCVFCGSCCLIQINKEIKINKNVFNKRFKLSIVTFRSRRLLNSYKTRATSRHVFVTTDGTNECELLVGVMSVIGTRIVQSIIKHSNNSRYCFCADRHRLSGIRCTAPSGDLEKTSFVSTAEMCGSQNYEFRVRDVYRPV